MQIYLSYGLGEGRWHGRRFTRALQEVGYSMTDRLDQADILIAHSGGIYVDRADTPPKLTVIINPSYGVSSPYPKVLGQKLWRDFSTLRTSGRTHEFFIKGCWLVFYALRDIRRTLGMALGYWREGFIKVLPKQNCVIIQTDNDPWYTAAGGPELPKHIQLHILPGEHDDCWLNPKSYVDLLQSMHT